MPLIAFVDNKLYQKIEKLSKNNTDVEEEYPEQEFIASCLRIGLTTKDLEELTYIEAMKVLYSFLEKDKDKSASQEDIDKFLM